MAVIYEERLSDSPFVETIWCTQSERDAQYIATADGRCEIVVLREVRNTSLVVTGPITKALSIPYAAGTEWFGIRLKLGVFMPHLPARNLLNGWITLPRATRKSFWLNGSTWQFFDYDNAETFVNRLVRDGLLAWDHVVAAVLRNQPQALAASTMRRHFLRATGIPQGAIRQIERARNAVALLEQGISILDTVFEAGYADQAHLTRSLKRFIGQTPTEIIRNNKSSG